MVNELTTVPTRLIQNFPRERSLQRIVTRERLSEIPDFVPSVPDVPESLKNNCRGEVFYRFDSGINDVTRYVIFSSDFQLGELTTFKTGVFTENLKSVPRHFTKLITLKGFYWGKFDRGEHV